jgi:hypothetical protein
MDEMEFTEAESNMQDLVAEYQQCTLFSPSSLMDNLADGSRPQTKRRRLMTRRSWRRVVRRCVSPFFIF